MTAFKGAREASGKMSAAGRWMDATNETHLQTRGGRTATSELRTRDANHAMLRLHIPSGSHILSHITFAARHPHRVTVATYFLAVLDFAVTLSIKETVSQTKGSL